MNFKFIVLASLLLCFKNLNAFEIKDATTSIHGDEIFITMLHDAGCRSRSLDLINISCSNDLATCQADLDISNYREDCTGHLYDEETQHIDLVRLGLYHKNFTNTKLSVYYGKNVFGFKKKFVVRLLGEGDGFE